MPAAEKGSAALAPLEEEGGAVLQERLGGPAALRAGAEEEEEAPAWRKLAWVQVAWQMWRSEAGAPTQLRLQRELEVHEALEPP